jgi:hypothetical protein
VACSNLYVPGCHQPVRGSGTVVALSVEARLPRFCPGVQVLAKGRNLTEARSVLLEQTSEVEDFADGRLVRSHSESGDQARLMHWASRPDFLGFARVCKSWQTAGI